MSHSNPSFFRWTTVPHCMTCLRTHITHTTPITLTRGWVTVIRASQADRLSVGLQVEVLQMEAEGIQTYPTHFCLQRPTGPHRLWSSLLSILGMRMNTCRSVFAFRILDLKS